MKKTKPTAPIIIQVPIAELSPAEYNPRAHAPKFLTKLKTSIIEFNAVEPIVINKDNTIISGHARVKAMQELGWENAPCIRVKISKKKEKALNLAMNKITGEWDDSLNDLLLELKDEPEFDLTGFELDELSEENIEINEIKIDKVPKTTWVLLSIPTVSFGKINEDIEKISNFPEVEIDITVTN